MTMKQIEDIVVRKLGEFKGNGGSFNGYGGGGGNAQPSFSNLNMPATSSMRKPSISIPAVSSMREFDSIATEDIVERIRAEMKDQLEDISKALTIKIKMDLKDSMITADDLDGVKRDLGTIDKYGKEILWFE